MCVYFFLFNFHRFSIGLDLASVSGNLPKPLHFLPPICSTNFVHMRCVCKSVILDKDRIRLSNRRQMIL